MHVCQEQRDECRYKRFVISPVKSQFDSCSAELKSKDERYSLGVEPLRIS